MTIWRRVGCWISKGTRTQEQIRALAPTHTHSYGHTHAHAYYHVILIALPRQQWFCERAECYVQCFFLSVVNMLTKLQFLFYVKQEA